MLTLDFSKVQTSDELHSLVADKLEFPSWYGRNFDALWDCIRDPQLSNIPVELCVTGLSDLARRLPREAQLIRECFAELPLERPEVHIRLLESAV